MDADTADNKSFPLPSSCSVDDQFEGTKSRGNEKKEVLLINTGD